MTQRLEEIANSIIICAAHDIDRHHKHHPDSPIFSVTDSDDLVWSSLDFNFESVIHYVSAMHNPPTSLEGADFESYRKHAILKDLEIAKEFLQDSDDQKVIFHCRAGVHKSPMFVFILLNHLQGENPDYDLSLKLLYKIRPEARLGSSLVLFDTYLGDQYNACKKALSDLMVAKMIGSLKDKGSLTETISTLFPDSSKTQKSKARDLCTRFGINQPLLQL